MGYTVRELRKMIQDRTWEEVVDWNIKGSPIDVTFSTRLGRFLTRPCIVVLALGKIVALRYVKEPANHFMFNFTISDAVGCGLAAVHADFGRFNGPKLTDKVIQLACVHRGRAR